MKNKSSKKWAYVFVFLLIFTIFTGSVSSEETTSNETYEQEPNNHFYSANKIEEGNIYTGEVYGGDTDYYEFSIKSDKNLMIALASSDYSEISIKLYNEARVLEDRATSEDGSTASIVYMNTIMDDKDYHTIYLKIEGIGNYSFKVDYYHSSSEDSDNPWESACICISAIIVAILVFVVKISKEAK